MKTKGGSSKSIVGRTRQDRKTKKTKALLRILNSKFTLDLKFCKKDQACLRGGVTKKE